MIYDFLRCIFFRAHFYSVSRESFIATLDSFRRDSLTMRKIPSGICWSAIIIYDYDKASVKKCEYERPHSVEYGRLHLYFWSADFPTSLLWSYCNCRGTRSAELKKKSWVARTKSPDESYATKESVYKSSANVWCARKILRAQNTHRSEAVPFCSVEMRCYWINPLYQMHPHLMVG